MKEWKIRQEIYHRLHKQYSDDLNSVEIHFTDNIAEDALKHFHEQVDKWIYPAKSYFVAICYASWIAEDFGEDFYQLLDDDMLLAGNDPYFVPYNEDKETYDKILQQIKIPLPRTGMVPDVKEYYDEEIGFRI